MDASNDVLDVLGRLILDRARLVAVARGEGIGMLEERGGEDVASALGITRSYVDVLLHRAKRQLRSCLIEA